mgnify:CR=1 FL=1
MASKQRLNVLVVDRDDLTDGLELFDEVDSLGAFDAVLAATARRCEAGALVSADVAFSTVADLHHLDPASPGFATALTRLH